MKKEDDTGLNSSVYDVPQILEEKIENSHGNGAVQKRTVGRLWRLRRLKDVAGSQKSRKMSLLISWKFF